MERLTRRDITGIPFCQDAGYLDMLNKLAAYEDAEEQGRLVVLPCKVGDIVYKVVGPCLPSFGTCPYDGGYGTYRCGPPNRCKPYIEKMKFSITMMPHFGRIYFKTKEEAEKALEGMNNG